MGEPVTLTYPTVDDIADRIVQLGTGCLLFKRDLKRAYGQLPVDPFDYPLLGYSWRDSLYFDVRLPMGLRSAAMACQRVTNAVCFILSQLDCQVLSYLDDFMGISPPSTASEHYTLSRSLLHALGLQESPHKVRPPSTQMTCLGVLFDTVNFTMTVTPDRLRELQEDLLPRWLQKKSASKTDLQSLIGKLAFVSKCVRPGRLFLCRILDTFVLSFRDYAVRCGIIIIASSSLQNLGRTSVGGFGLLAFTMVFRSSLHTSGLRRIVFFPPMLV